MDAFETLMSEHRLIESVIDALGGYMQELTTAGTASREELGRFAEFFKGYADAFHHAKEENILFNVMCANGFSQTSGPVAAMLADHEQNRHYTQILKFAADRGDAPWSEEEIAEVVAAAGAYSYLLAGHIQKEDGILYPMAKSRLPVAALQEIAAAFEKHAADQSTLAQQEHLRILAAGLAERFAQSV
jgi:hemerythrin-like domain-containing protein